MSLSMPDVQALVRMDICRQIRSASELGILSRHQRHLSSRRYEIGCTVRAAVHSTKVSLVLGSVCFV